MKKGWTTTKLIAVASLGVLSMILKLTGAGLAAALGNLPMVSGITNVFFSEIMVIICLLVVDTFGAATTMRLIIGVLSLPLPLLGTPGFLPKIPIAIVAGLIADGLYQLLKRNKVVAALVIGGIAEVYYGFAILGLGHLFGMPGIEQTGELFLRAPAIAGTFVMGAIGGYTGWLIYCKIKNTAVVKRIQR